MRMALYTQDSVSELCLMAREDLLFKIKTTLKATSFKEIQSTA